MNKFEPTAADYDSMARYNSLFPLNYFPLEMQEIIIQTHRKLGFPIDYIGSAILSAVSGAIGNQARLRVKESWTESAVIYMVLVGNAGANKSHPMSFAMRPLINADMKELERFKRDKRNYDEGLITTLTPASRRVVSDTTVEGLASLHEENPAGLILYADELKSWISNFDRYSTGSQEQFWLSNFSSTPIMVDRRDTTKSSSIRHPFISVLGSTQPRILASFFKGDKAFNGFFDRLLFSIIENAEKEYWHAEEIDPAIEQRYDSFIKEVMSLGSVLAEYGEPQQLEVRFSPEAMAEVMEWQRYNADTVNDSNDDTQRGVQTKLENYMLRLSLISHFIRYYLTGEVDNIGIIDLGSIRMALRLVEYYRVQAMIAIKMVQEATQKPPTHKEITLIDMLPTTFARHEILAAANKLGVSERSAYRIIDKYCGTLLAKEGYNNYRKTS